MAKFILKEPSEDDPIFSGGFVISSPRRIPKSKKSNLISQSAMDEQETLDPIDDTEPA